MGTRLCVLAAQGPRSADPAVPPLQSTIVAVIAFYWVCSLAVVFLNKFILSYGAYKFPYPLCVARPVAPLIVFTCCYPRGPDS